MPGLKERAKTLVELSTAPLRLADRPLALDDKARRLLTAEARAVSAPAQTRAVEPWTRRRTEQAVRAFAERAGSSSARRAAAARGADRTHHLARHFRRAGRAGEERKPGRLADQAVPRRQR
jgi:glutamyl-tRNA synthetase